VQVSERNDPLALSGYRNSELRVSIRVKQDGQPVPLAGTYVKLTLRPPSTDPIDYDTIATPNAITADADGWIHITLPREDMTFSQARWGIGLDEGDGFDVLVAGTLKLKDGVVDAP